MGQNDHGFGFERLLQMTSLLDHEKIQSFDMFVQYWSVDSSAEFGEEALGVPRIFSYGRSDVFDFLDTEARNNGISDGSHILRRVTCADATGVFPQRHVAYPV